MHPVEVLLFPIGWALRNRRADDTLSFTNSPEMATENHITLNSPNFHEGQTIPARHCGKFIGDNISPALTWSALPPGTVALLLVFEDLDNPRAVPGVHTVAAFTPRPGGLSEGALTPQDPSIRFMGNPRGQATYVGPRPIPGHGTHRYRFRFYALDCDVDVTQIAEAGQLPHLLQGHILARGTLIGTRTA